MSAPENPPAFPCAGPTIPAQEGMTLRDWFAGQALQGWLASWPDGSDADRESEAKVAAFSYRLADAMLRARQDVPLSQSKDGE